MDTARGHAGLKITNSLRFKIFLGFTVLAAALLLILNIYPVRMMRRQLVEAKEGEMRFNVSALSAALESSSFMDYDTASSAISIMDIGRDQRVLVTDGEGKVIYDNLKFSDVIGKTVLFPEVIEALCGRDVFKSVYDGKAFSHRATCAVMRDGQVVGSVYAYQYDLESAQLLAGTKSNIARISFAVTAATAVFVVFFTTSLRRRFDRVLEGVAQIRGGNYEYRINMESEDELGVIAAEFDQMSDQLTKTEETRRQFVSDASHELKTPLASIKLLCDSILQTENIKVEDVREFLGDIRDEIDRLTRISDGLLYLSRLDSGEASAGECDLTQLVNRASELLRAYADEFEVKIVISLPPSAYIKGSSDMAYQAVFNLMQNAVKYNRRGGTVHVTLKEGEDKWLLHVADTGIGIKEEELGRIFDRFYRVDKMRSRETGGTGLGLSIVGRCLDALGGHVEVTSTYGEGSCFTAYFPMAERGEVEI